MESPSGNRVKFRSIFGFFDYGQHCAKFSLILPRDTAHLTASPESLKFPIPKAEDSHY